jgi:hypothetical protein
MFNRLKRGKYPDVDKPFPLKLFKGIIKLRLVVPEQRGCTIRVHKTRDASQVSIKEIWDFTSSVIYLGLQFILLYHIVG